MVKKLFFSTVALAGLAKASPHVSSMHKSASNTLINKEKHVLVKAFGYEFPEKRNYTEESNVWKFEFESTIDISLGYSGLLFYTVHD